MALAVVDLPEGFKGGVGATVAQVLEIVLRGVEGFLLGGAAPVEGIEDAKITFGGGA